MPDWAEWIGRSEERRDRVDPAAVSRWLATFDRAAPADSTVPQAYHWCLGLPDAPSATLGEDGHPRRDDTAASFLPPVPLPRRMWASSKVEFIAPLLVGEAVTRSSKVAAITEKSGGSGQLVFVEIAHETSSERRLAVREVQSLVYRDAAAPGIPAAPPPLGEDEFDPGEWPVHRVVTPSEALLFRYSALTFNSHRIHYDHPYTTKIEGYPGLVVHGPLIATLLVDLLRRQKPGVELAGYDFRALRPLYDVAPFDTCGAPDEVACSARLWTRDAEGAVTMEATAKW